MNIITRKIARMREWLSDRIIHVGWACWGQECDCNASPHFNGVARRVAKYLDTLEYDDNYDCKQWQGRVSWRVGKAIVDFATRLINGPMMQDFYAERQADAIKAEAIEVAQQEAWDNAVDVTPQRKSHNTLPKRMRIELWHSYRKGTPVKELALEYDVSQSTAYRYIRAEEDESALAIWRSMNPPKTEDVQEHH